MHCSFCHIVGHTIQRCNSPQIEDEYNTIRRFYEDACSHNISGFGLFVNFVDINFTEISVKAIAFRYIGGDASRISSKRRIIQRLWVYISSSVSPLSWTIDRTGLTGEEEQPLPLYDLPPVATNMIYTEFYISELLDSEDRIQGATGARGQREARGQPNPANWRLRFDSLVSSIPKYDMTISFEEEGCKEGFKEDCGICYELTNEIDNVYLDCGHKFCGQCMKSCLNVGKIVCAMCRCPITIMTVRNLKIYDLVSEYCK